MTLAGIVSHEIDHRRMKVIPMASVYTFVDFYGADSTGSVVSTDALRAAIVAAGVGGTLFFYPKATYLVDGSLWPKEGQRWVMNGATIKRTNGISDTISANVAINDTTVSVNTPSAFRVGMGINISDGANVDSYTPQIIGITGSVLTVFPAFTRAFTAGDTIFSACRMVNVPSDGTISNVKISHGIFDGNRANNTVNARWEAFGTIGFWAGSNNAISDCYIDNSVGDGILTGGVDTKVERNYVRYSGTAAIHLAAPGCSNVGVKDNVLLFSNINTLAEAGREEGTVTWSNNVVDVTVSGNYIEGSRTAAFGGMGDDGGYGALITNNTVLNCGLLLDLQYGVNTPITQTLAAGELTSVGLVATINSVGIGASATVGHKILINGVDQAEYNGHFIPTSVTADSISFTFRGSATAIATGTIKVLLVAVTPNDITFSNNKCYDCGTINVRYLGTSYSDATAADRINFKDNTFVNCNADIRMSRGVHFTGNVWLWEAGAPPAPVGGFIQFNACQNCSVDDLTMEGGAHGVRVIPTTGSKNISIKVALLINQQFTGVYIESGGDTWAGIVVRDSLASGTKAIAAGLKGFRSDVSGVRFINCHVSASAAIAAGFYFKDVATGVIVQSCSSILKSTGLVLETAGTATGVVIHDMVTNSAMTLVGTNDLNANVIVTP